MNKSSLTLLLACGETSGHFSWGGPNGLGAPLDGEEFTLHSGKLENSRRQHFLQQKTFFISHIRHLPSTAFTHVRGNFQPIPTYYSILFLFNLIHAHNKPVRVNELICDLDPYAAGVDHFADTSGKAGDYRYLLGIFCNPKQRRRKDSQMNFCSDKELE